MLVQQYAAEDRHGYFLDARTTPYKWIHMNEVSVIKITLLKKDWYCIPHFAKAINIKPNSRQWAKKLNKQKEGTAVRIYLFAQTVMWFATEEGLHKIFDDALDINQLNLSL